jgi:hypothetical protein
LHLAAKQTPSVELLELCEALLGVYGEGGSAKGAGEAVPLQLALREDHSSHVAALLARGLPQAEEIRAAWEQAARQRGEKSVLRLGGFEALSREQLREVFEPFGTVRLLHHVQGHSSESVVVFATEEAAVAAKEAYERGSLKPLDTAPNGRTYDCGPLGLAGSSKTCGGPGWAFDYACVGENEGYFRFRDTEYTYFSNLEEAVEAMREVLPAAERWAERCREAEARGASVAEVAALQLEMSEAMEVRGGAEAEVQAWQEGMAAMAQRRLAMHVDRFADTLLELLSFCDQDRLGEYDIETE